jgi:D-alanine-D-alanine ligase
VLDWMRLPYTHSGVRASALAMDKQAAKAVFRAAGLTVPEGYVTDRVELEMRDPLPRPFVLKPVNEGSSVGVVILREGDNRRAEIAQGWRFGDRIMAERFIPGRELTVAVMGDRPLAVTEIETGHVFYDYEAKYADGGSRHTIPARIHPLAAERAMEMALAAHNALGCRGVSRADFRYDDSFGEPGQVVLLEVNTQPGMTATSLVPEQAAHCGIGFPALCAWMVEHARHGP